MKAFPYLFVTLLLVVGCTTTIEEQEKYGDIVGIVYDNSVGEPISVAQVSLTPGGNSTVTGTDGSFSFNNIEAGEYTITVNKKGYTDGSNKVIVVAGKQSNCNLLMERIPAYVTADKEELDFGENASSNTLSFNIVNSSYENLSWHIEYDKSSTSFIAEITPESGTTQYGKTAAIVVKIDRDKLNAGLNETTIVVVSDNGDGSSEVKIRAVGQEREKARLNMIGVSDITSSTAILKGKIEFPGIPVYTERGFVCGLSQNPTLGNSIQQKSVAVNNESEFSAYITGLDYGNKYYVRAYAINSEGEAYSNQVDFTMVATPPKASMYSVDNISATNKSAKLHGSIDSPGDPAFTERGFVYSSIKNTPTINDQYIKVEGNEVGSYETVITDLAIDKEYYVRAYAKNAGGISYSEQAEPFTVRITLPEVELTSISNINSSTKTATFRGLIKNSGDPAYTELGFVYSTSNEMPTISDITIKAEVEQTNNFEVNVSGLSYGTVYYVRAYAINSGGVAYSSGEVVSFSLPTNMPSVTTLESTNINRGNGSVTLNAKITSSGVPGYTERGFVYSKTNSKPTISDSKIVVQGNGDGEYSISTSLERTGTTYVRAYVTSELGTVYGDAIKALGPEYVYISGSRLYVQIVDRGGYPFSSASNACTSSKVEGLTGWRLPSLDELKVLYTNRSIIGGFSSGTYWSNSYTYEQLWNGNRVIAYYVLNFSSGASSTLQVEYSPYNTMSYLVRCVR